MDVVIIINIGTGKLLDVNIFFKYCYGKIKISTFEIANKNFEGYSSRIKEYGVLPIFRRTISRYKIQNTKYSIYKKFRRLKP